MLRLLFLGSGTSYGVPMIGCDCSVCCSADPRNRRTRASALVRVDGGNILIDTATDLREQALRHNVRRVDAILFTHAHADHLNGLDDIRAFSGIQRKVIPAYGNAATVERIQRNFSYIFHDTDFKLGWGIPRLDLTVIEKPTVVCGVSVIPVPIFHGPRTIFGYRIGRMAYLTDCSGIPEASLSLLVDLDVLVLTGLRHRPHPMHFSVAQALKMVERLRPRRAWLTHLTHELDHTATEATLPPDVHLAYDGLEIEVTQ